MSQLSSELKLQMTNTISCNLTENAIDYLLLAGEQVQDGSDRLIKHSIATLADGVELLLKARVEKKDWSFLFKDVDKAKLSAYESGDFISITFAQAIKRLENICDVPVAPASFAIIEDLRQYRNRIRHLAISVDAQVALSLVAKTFAFALEFVAEHLEHAKDGCSDELEKLRELLGNLDEFVDERFQQIDEQIDSHSAPALDCPICLQTAYMIEGDKVRCYFCEHEATPEEAAGEWISKLDPYRRLKESLIDPKVRWCPECETESCVSMAANTDGRVGHICFSCGTEGDYHDCSRCGNWCGQDCDVCGNCRDVIMSKYD